MAEHVWPSPVFKESAANLGFTMASFYAGNLVGHTLGSRFRLTALLGVGASARVYLAEDIKLRRRVAVKLLHASLASDEAFLRRFQREAEVLSPLSHQNIVIVHDVNHRENALGEPPYLVTEYLAGGSLRNLLDTSLLLTPSQACVMGLGAARGLQFAHAHGLVHRDIKPANLLFGEDQRVRISDFGLARALTEHARTEPEGALVGTARYLSPEQAKGQNLDGRSDVYSLALVLAESLTGTVPFSADTWQGTALARLDGPLPLDDRYAELTELLVNATAVDPSKRLDAAGLALALEDLARTLPAAGSLPLDGSRVIERAALLDERDPTMFAGVGSIANAVASAKAPQTPGFFDAAIDDTQFARGSKSKDSEQSKKSKRNDDEPAPRRKRRYIAPVIAALIGAVAAGGIAVGVTFARKTPSYLVPKLTGLTKQAADQEVLDEKFVISTLVPQFDETVPAGLIISQSPEPGVKLKEQSVLTITISRGLEPVEVPVLVPNVSLETATALLRAKGLTVNLPPTPQSNDTVPVGQVISWSPQGKVDPGTTISLVISSGPAALPLPKLRGLTADEATAKLPAGVTGQVIELASDTKKGIVTGSDPKAEALVKSGDIVKIYVSKGPEIRPILEVPNVINMSTADAARALKAAGFTIGKTIGPADKPVLHTRPIRRQKVKAGTAITLYTTEENVPEVPGITDRVPKTAPKKTVPPTTEAPIARTLPNSEAAPAT
jgi:eukaryotic-like serine/threonine-protein kinase